MYNNIYDENKVYEGKMIILEKQKVPKTYFVLTAQIAKQQTLLECFNEIRSYGFESIGSKNINKKLFKMIAIACQLCKDKGFFRLNPSYES